MKKLLLTLLLLVTASRAVDTLTIPTDFNTVSTGTRANLSGNFTSVQTWGNKIRDSIANVTGVVSGFSGTLLIRSLSDLRLKLDYDNNETARLLVESGTGDSLFTVREDTTARFYKHLTVDSNLTVNRKLILADTLRLTQQTASRLLAVNANKQAISNAALTINGFAYPDGAGSLASTAAATNGQLLIGSTSAAPVLASLTGTTNQVTVTPGAGSITLATPQNIHTGASPTFVGLTLTGNETVAKVTASDTVIGANLKTSGSLTVTGNETVAKVTASDSILGTVGKFSSNVVAAGTSSFANTTNSGTLGVTGATTLSSDLSIAGNIIGTTTPLVIRQNTSAASDVARVDITGGGGNGSDITRGAYLSLRGNNNGLAGLIQVVAGNVTGGQIIFYTGNSTARLTINETGTAAFSGPVTAASTLGVNGNTTLSGFNSIGTSAPASNMALNIQGALAYTSANQYGLASQSTFNSSATGSGNAIYAQAGTAATAFTMATGRGIYIDNPNKGATSAITTAIGLEIASQTAGGTNYAIKTGTGQVSIGDSLIGVSERLTGSIAADTLISSKFYAEGTFTITLQGVSVSTTGTASYVRVGKMVTLHIPNLLNTSNTTACTLIGVPAVIRPPSGAEDVQIIRSIYDNSVSHDGYLSIHADGTILIGFTTAITGDATATFTASGTKGINGPVTVTYGLF